MSVESSIPIGDGIERPRRQVVRDTLIAWTIAIAFACLTFSPGYITSTGPYWTPPRGDIGSGQIGWLYYAQQPWHLPLFAVDRMNEPEGSVLTLSDSLPLLALPAKLVYSLTGWLPFYMGFWIALCYALQAVFASRLMTALDIRDAPSRIAGILLFCYAPTLLIRFGHGTLVGHFLVLIGLERYFTAKRDGGLTMRGWMGLCALPVLGILMNPYMAAMGAIMVGLVVADQWRERSIDWRRALGLLGGSAAATIAVGVIGGLFRGGGQPSPGFGTFSFNLLAPFVPLGTTASGRWLGTQQPNLPNSWQWEGTAYLGAGVLLLCVAALPALRDWRVHLRRHAVLSMVSVALLVFACSNRVGFGAHELLHYPLPAPLIRLLSEFRGTGRFVWPPLYALMALVIATAHRLGPRRGMALVVLAGLVQVADMRPMQTWVRNTTSASTPRALTFGAWSALVDGHQRIFQFPSQDCGGVFGSGIPNGPQRMLEIYRIAAEKATPINSAYLARRIKDCERERVEARTNVNRPGTLYLYRDDVAQRATLAQDGVDFSRCGVLDTIAVCSADRDLSGLR